MTDPSRPFDPMNAAHPPLFTGQGLMGEGGALQWTDASDLFWRDAFRTRTYVRADSRYEEYRGAYRYGHESAGRRSGNCEWVEVEPELAAGWDMYEHRGECRGDWQSVREAVKEAWARARQALRI